MSSETQIIPLDRSPRAVGRFLKVSYAVYRDDPCWVAPLLSDAKKGLSPANPFFQHAQMQLWVAHRQGRDVGRIAGILNQAHNDQHQEVAGFFGFFEALPEADSSGRLFEALFAWARQHGLRKLIGPMNPSTNDECGLLVEGFDSSPVFMMTYNLPYYQELVAAAGFVKIKDLLAFHFNLNHSPRERLERIAQAFARRQQGLTIRKIRRAELRLELGKMREVYNSAWADNWGFVPLTDAEIRYLADRLEPLYRDGFLWLAETPAEPAAFLLAVPDLNQVIRPLQGRLLSPGLPRALPYLLGWRQPTRARVVTLGVKAKYRGRGIEAVMFAEGLKCAAQLGYQDCEASWILEDNLPVQRLIDLFGGRPYKTYRLYARDL